MQGRRRCLRRRVFTPPKGIPGSFMIYKKQGEKQMKRSKERLMTPRQLKECSPLYLPIELSVLKGVKKLFQSGRYSKKKVFRTPLFYCSFSNSQKSGTRRGA